MTAIKGEGKCSYCGKVNKYVITFDALDRREAAIAQKESELRRREQELSVRAADHQSDVRLIRSCLHPDKHPQNAERYTKAWLALDRLLQSGNVAAAEDDDIPF